MTKLRKVFIEEKTKILFDGTIKPLSRLLSVCKTDRERWEVLRKYYDISIFGRHEETHP